MYRILRMEGAVITAISIRWGGGIGVGIAWLGR
jgi:hypothetical protein